MLSGYELLLSYCHPTCLRLPFSPSPPLISFKKIHTASKSPKKNQRYYAKRGNKQNKKTHIALFCDGNFKQFRKPELCSEGLSDPLWVSGVLLCVDWVGPYLLSFPNEAKVTGSNHYLRLQPQRECASIFTSDGKGITELLIPH